MNINFTNTEETTTAHFGANETQLCLYPAVIKFKIPGEDRVRKGGIAFVSKDRLHDYQQSECSLFFVCLFLCQKIDQLLQYVFITYFLQSLCLRRKSFRSCATDTD